MEEKKYTMKNFEEELPKLAAQLAVFKFKLKFVENEVSTYPEDLLEELIERCNYIQSIFRKFISAQKKVREQSA